MLDLVFVDAAAATVCVAPIMLDYEFAVRARLRHTDGSADLNPQSSRRSAAAPIVLHVSVGAVMAHAPAFVSLAVENACDSRDGLAGHDLFYETYGPSGLLRELPLDVEAQIHFLKIHVPRDGNSEHA